MIISTSSRLLNAQPADLATSCCRVWIMSHGRYNYFWVNWHRGYGEISSKWCPSYKLIKFKAK